MRIHGDQTDRSPPAPGFSPSIFLHIRTASGASTVRSSLDAHQCSLARLGMNPSEASGTLIRPPLNEREVGRQPRAVTSAWPLQMPAHAPQLPASAPVAQTSFTTRPAAGEMTVQRYCVHSDTPQVRLPRLDRSRDGHDGRADATSEVLAPDRSHSEPACTHVLLSALRSIHRETRGADSSRPAGSASLLRPGDA